VVQAQHGRRNAMLPRDQRRLLAVVPGDLLARTPSLPSRVTSPASPDELRDIAPSKASSVLTGSQLGTSPAHATLGSSSSRLFFASP
jgi:hypothetical protein